MARISPCTRLRELLARPGITVAPNIWDPFSARVAEQLGIECVVLGGYAMGAGTVISEPLMTMTEVVDLTRNITRVVHIPIIVDVGTGFGEPLHVMRMMKEIERAGAASIHIEDQIYPKRAHYHKGIEHIVSRKDMVARIKACVAARTDPDHVIIARTDAVKTDNFAEAVERCNLYLEAGADVGMLFPTSEEEVRQAPREIHGPLYFPMAEGFGRATFSARELEDMGYKIMSLPVTLICAAAHELKRVIINIRTKGVSGVPAGEMAQWRKEVEELIGLDEYYRIEAETVEF